MLVRLLGARGLADAAAAGVMGFCMPALFSGGAIRHLWHSVKSRWQPASMFGGAAPATPALFRMHAWSASVRPADEFVSVPDDGGIIFAGFAQDCIDGRRSLWRLASEVLVIGASLTLVVLGSGLLGSGGSLRAPGFGIFSTNLLGPFIPQMSGLFPGMAHLIIDGTGGQYEGFSYLGCGLLLLLAILAPKASNLPAMVRRHVMIAAFILACSVFSLSDIIYFGPWR